MVTKVGMCGGLCIAATFFYSFFFFFFSFFFGVKALHLGAKKKLHCTKEGGSLVIVIM